MKSIAGKLQEKLHFGKKQSMGNSSTTMHASSGQHASFSKGSQQSVRADLPNLLSPHRNSFESPAQRECHRKWTLTRHLNDDDLAQSALVKEMQKQMEEMKKANAEMIKAKKLPGKSLGYVLAGKSWIFGDIQPWAATTLVREKLEKQAVLKENSPVLLHLQNLPVADGLKLFKSKLGTMRGLDEDAFVKIVSESYPQAVVSPEMKESIAEIITSDALYVFGFMDSHATNQLSIGEWAGAMAGFFEGTQEEKARALFDLLDEHSKGWLSNEELQQYLIAPVKAMTPSEASPLVPLLLRLCADQIMESASFTDRSKICCQDFVHWQSKNNDAQGLIDFLAKFVEEEVYKGYLHWAEASSGFIEL